MILRLVVTLLGVTPIAWVNWYFLLAGRHRKGS